MLILILTIIGVVVGLLTFSGLTGPRLFKYAKDVTSKRSRNQIAYLVYAVAMTGIFIFLAVEVSKTLGLAGALAAIAFIPLIWFETLLDVWKLKLSKRGEKAAAVARLIIALAMLSLMITSAILTDGNRPLSEKLAPILGGFGFGGGLQALDWYIRKKRVSKGLSQSTKKDSPI
jgi:hypothetical protein